MSTEMISQKEGDIERGFAPRNFEELLKLSKFFSNSQLVPKKLRGNPADIALMCLIGQDLGLSFPATLQNVFVFDARPTIAAKLAMALVLRSQKAAYFRCIETSDQSATFETHRLGDPEPVQFTFTIEMAKTAGLLGKDNWKNHPGAMLRARAIKALAEMVYPDVLTGVDVETSDAPMRAEITSEPPEPETQEDIVDSETGEVTEEAPQTGWAADLAGLEEL